MSPEAKDPATAWLLSSADPSVRYLTLVDVIGESPRSKAVRAAKDEIMKGPRMRALLKGQRADGGFGGHPYQKWTGAHWRLVSMIELGVPRSDPRPRKATNLVLEWLNDEARLNGMSRPNGRVRIHASQEGNALGVCSRLGMARDPRVKALAERLMEFQWADGGWNCDRKPQANHSSFYESITPLWGLTEYAFVTGDREAQLAVDRAAELFLEHQIFRSSTTGDVIDPRWLKLRYPLYWYYDTLHALLILSRAGKVLDPRAKEALDIVESKRDKNGLWRSEGYYWRPAGSKGSNVEVVDWGRGGPNELITLNALRVLKAAGRLYGQTNSTSLRTIVSTSSPQRS